MSRRADIALRDTDLDHLLLDRLPSRLTTLLLVGPLLVVSEGELLQNTGTSVEGPYSTTKKIIQQTKKKKKAHTELFG